MPWKPKFIDPKDLEIVDGPKVEIKASLPPAAKEPLPNNSHSKSSKTMDKAPAIVETTEMSSGSVDVHVSPVQNGGHGTDVPLDTESENYTIPITDQDKEKVMEKSEDTESFTYQLGPNDSGDNTAETNLTFSADVTVDPDNSGSLNKTDNNIQVPQAGDVIEGSGTLVTEKGDDVTTDSHTLTVTSTSDVTDTAKDVTTTVTNAEGVKKDVDAKNATNVTKTSETPAQNGTPETNTTIANTSNEHTTGMSQSVPVSQTKNETQQRAVSKFPSDVIRRSTNTSPCAEVTGTGVPVSESTLETPVSTGGPQEAATSSSTSINNITSSPVSTTGTPESTTGALMSAVDTKKTDTSAQVSTTATTESTTSSEVPATETRAPSTSNQELITGAATSTSETMVSTSDSEVSTTGTTVANVRRRDAKQEGSKSIPQRPASTCLEIQLSAPEPPRLEDQLSDYQPPKQYVKREDKQSRASPALHITDSKKSQPSTPRMSQERENDTSAEYSVEPSKPFKSLKQTWGTPAGDSDNYCKGCGKRVYEMEKIYANNAAYHKTCFRCSHCNSVLRLGNFAAMNGELYCKPHFMSLFKTKGNYDEGFGKEKHSKQWTNKDTPTRETGPKEVTLKENLYSESTS